MSKKPFVSVLTPTYNRKEWFPMAVHCYKHQTYPHDRMEWIILDDSNEDQKVEELLKEVQKDIPNIRYIRLTERIKLGRKRNMLNKEAKGDIIVFQDDDDYYPPQRVSKSVFHLTGTKNDIAASSRMHIYFTFDGKITSVGPYGPNHSTAGTWAFKRKVLSDSPGFDDEAEKAEERRFLKDYKFPTYQMDPFDVILVMSHIRNTVDKNKLRENPERCLMKDTGMGLKVFLKKDKWAYEFITMMTERNRKDLENKTVESSS